MDLLSVEIPEHVPAELVVPFDQLNGPEIHNFPPTAALGIGEEKPVFYSSLYGGFWVFTRFEDARAIYLNPDVFAQWPNGFPPNPFSKLYKPLYLNPPEHLPWRRVLTPIFSPRQMAKNEDFIRENVRAELAKIAPAGRCEFVTQFADVIPGRMFCFQLGLPEADYPRFSGLAHDLIFGPAKVLREGGSPDDARAFRVRVNAEIDDFIAKLIPERRQNPGDDIVSVLLEGQVDGEPLTDEDIVTMTTLLFFAGTDSTRAAITYAFMYLAQHPELRDRLVRGEVEVKKASEELIRLHGFHFSSRQATKDFEIAGVTIKKGDRVTMSTGAANRDPDKFPDPATADFERDNAHSNLTFGAGIHRCIGSPLATLQLRVALDEVHKVITDYRIDEDAEPVTYVSGQGKTIPFNLPLTYTPVEFDPTA